jgi:hypothetical protein
VAHDYIPKDEQIDMRALLEEHKTQLALTAAGSAGVMMMTGDNRSRLAQYPYNFLRGFYGGGRGNQAIATGREVAANALPVMRDLVDPRTSYAYKKTGMSTRGYNELLKLQDDIGNLQEEMGRQIKVGSDGKDKFKNKEAESIFRESRRTLATKQRQQHYKLINDYSNRFLHRKNPPEMDDVARYAKQWVEPVSKKRALASLGGTNEIAEYMVKNQPGMKNLDKIRFLEHTQGAKVGDVMRGIQFDKPVFNTFIRFNEIGLDNLTPNKVKVAIAKMNKASPERAFKSFGKKGEERIFFKVSPNMKPNYDWGGYQGIVEWDERNPTKVKFYANDKRDLFGMKLGGKNVLNIAPPREISIPEVMTDIQDDLPVKRKKEIVKQTVKKYNTKEKLKNLVTNDKFPGINKQDSIRIDELLKKHGGYLKQKIFQRKMISPFWLMRHAAMGLGGLSVAALLILASGSLIDYYKSKDRTWKE